MKNAKDTNPEIQSKMQNFDKNDINSTILSTFFKTLLYVISLAAFIFASLICLFPKAAVSLTTSLGLNGGRALAYKVIYTRSEKATDLYNLIIASIDAGTSKDTVKYIDLMQDRDDYEAFYQQVDASARAASASKKQNIALVGDYDGFLNSTKVEALVKLKKYDDAQKTALKDLQNENEFSFAFYNYVFEAFKNNKHARENIALILDKDVNGKTVLEWIDDRAATLEAATGNGAEKILATYTLMKIETTKYTIYSKMGEEKKAEASQAAARFDELKTQYEALIA